MKKVKVEIWSDVACPWCYIGKRRFEEALTRFEQRNNVEIEWKSFQLDPSLKTEPGKSIHQMLAEKKNWSVDYAREMNANVTTIAKEAGLNYNLDNIVVANTFNAHRLIQLAKKHGLGSAAEECLFKAYFVEGRNIDDRQTILQLGAEIGIDPSDTQAMLESESSADDVTKDIYEAQQVGVRGVPFFVFNNKYAVSGAQPTSTFLDILNKAWQG